MGLEVEGVEFSYGGPGSSFALRDVGFSAPPGAFTALLGVNGAGKSTLLGIVTRLFEAAGEVRVCGHSLRREPLAALARMGVVFQQPTLDLDLTVRQNLLYAAGLRGLSRREAEERGADLLTRFGLAERVGTKVRQLNGGHRRRVEVVRALLHRPPLLILDEPTVGLDPPTRRALVDHVHALCRDDGVAALWATHLFDEIGPADRVVVIDRGRIVAAGPVADILARTNSTTLEQAFRELTGRPA